VTGHFKPFFTKVIDAMERDQNSWAELLVLSIVRLSIILVLAGVFFSLKKLLLSPVLGQDIEVEEEIIIVHEYATQEEADQAAAAAAIHGNEYYGSDASYLQAAAAAAATTTTRQQQQSAPSSLSTTSQSRKKGRGKKQKHS
jgi:hypothetical protein